MMIQKLILLCALSTQIMAQPKVALVIGNSKYEKASALHNPVNDAHLVSSTFTELGFQVIMGVDLSNAEMKHKIRDFGRSLDQAEVAVCFYAGHGLEVRGENYLVPISADIEQEYEVEDECVSVNRILATMENSDAGVNILILDSCRNNPFARSWRSGGSSGGLAQMSAPPSTLLCYATAPNETASDGSVGEQNSPFTKAFVAALKVKGLPHPQLFQRVKRMVVQSTQHLEHVQRPWTADDLLADFYFHDASAAEQPPVEAPAPTITPAQPILAAGKDFFLSLIHI